MKKKFLIGLGTIALVALLNLNINLAKTNNDGNFSLKNLFSMAKAECEYDPTTECHTWCWPWEFHTCELHACEDIIYCSHMYWP